LADRSLDIARHFLEPRGKFFVKVFHGSELQRFKRRVEDYFEQTRYVKPPASRSRSSETYVIALGFRGGE
jgi:23S rRNA (uridine2552-2'-O)-methyltransferase